MVEAKILKFRKGKQAVRKGLFIRNGSINQNIAIEINKNFTIEDAKAIVKKIAKGNF